MGGLKTTAVVAALAAGLANGMTNPSSLLNGASTASATTAPANPSADGLVINNIAYALFVAANIAMDDLFSITGMAFGTERAGKIDQQVISEVVLCPFTKDVSGTVNRALDVYGDETPVVGGMIGQLNQFLGKSQGYLGMTSHGRVACDFNHLNLARYRVTSRLQSSRRGGRRQKRQQENLGDITDTAAAATPSAHGPTLNPETMVTLAEAVNSLMGAVSLTGDTTFGGSDANAGDASIMNNGFMCPMIGDLAKAVNSVNGYLGDIPPAGPEMAQLQSAAGKADMISSMVAKYRMNCPAVNDLTITNNKMKAKIQHTSSSGGPKSSLKTLSPAASTRAPASASTTSALSKEGQNTGMPAQSHLEPTTKARTLSGVWQQNLRASQGQPKSQSQLLALPSRNPQSSPGSAPAQSQAQLGHPTSYASNRTTAAAPNSQPPWYNTTLFRTVQLPPVIPTNLPPGVYPVGFPHPEPVYMTMTHTVDSGSGVRANKAAVHNPGVEKPADVPRPQVQAPPAPKATTTWAPLAPQGLAAPRHQAQAPAAAPRFEYAQLAGQAHQAGQGQPPRLIYKTIQRRGFIVGGQVQH